jgi:hypothetical protein
MKKVLLASTCFMALLASAQKPMNNSTMVAPVINTDKAQSARATHDNPSRGGSVFFYEDFSMGLDGSTAYGAWTVADNADNSIWHLASASSPDGPIAGTLPGLASESAANGWMIFDPDQYIGANPTWDDADGSYTTGYLISPEINMSSLGSVLVNYQQYFVYCCFPFSPLTVEVSIDGQQTWVSFPAHGNFIESANTISDNALNTTVDISCVAAYQPSVYIRFAYNSAEQAGYNYYFWCLDDVRISSNGSMNEIAISEITNGNIITYWEFHETPMEQVVAAADGGVTAGVIFANRGLYAQPNVTMLAEFVDASNNVVYSFETDPFEVLSPSTNTQCPAPEYDTLFIPTGFEPAGAGTYTMRITMLGDSIDDTPSDNVLEKTIVFSDDEYGHDVEGAAYSNLGTTQATGSTEYTPGGWGNYYACPNAGSTAYGVSTRFGTNSQNNVEFKVALIQQSPDLSLTDSDVIAEEYYTMGQSWHTGSFVYFPFDASVDLEQNTPYFACVWRETQGAGRLTMSVQNGPDSDLSTGSWELSGSGDYAWFLFQTFTPAVRLILSERVGVDELSNTSGLRKFDVFPNPAVTYTRVNFSLEGSRSIAFEIRDLQGKLMKWSNVGVFPQGENNFDVNTSELAAGNYILNLVVDGQQLFSRPLAIQK